MRDFAAMTQWELNSISKSPGYCSYQRKTQALQKSGGNLIVHIPGAVVLTRQYPAETLPGSTLVILFGTAIMKYIYIYNYVDQHHTHKQE